jgi:hypothetical protein
MHLDLKKECDVSVEGYHAKVGSTVSRSAWDAFQQDRLSSEFTKAKFTTA